jgi:hypothetical protein
MSVLDSVIGWLRGRSEQPSSQAVPVAVVAGEPIADSPLVLQMAERLRQRDLADGGWAAEAGALPMESYLPEARRLVRGIALGELGGGPPAP